MAKTKRVSRAERDRSTVFKYQYYEDLKACLQSGWSPEGTHKYCDNLYGSAPSIMAIRRWRDKHMPTAMVIPHQFIMDKLNGVDYKVDILKHLSRLVPLLEERMARGLSQEVNSFGGLPLPVNDGVIRIYLEALRDWKTVAQDLGIMQAPAPPVFDFSTKNLNITPDALEELRVVAEEIAKIGSPVRNAERS